MSKKVFINANLWDGYADSVFKKCAVFVDGDKIAKISYDVNPTFRDTKLSTSTANTLRRDL